MKTWKNRNRRSKKHKQRGGKKYNVAELKPKVEALLQSPRFSNPVGADIDFKVILNTLKGKLDAAKEDTIDLIQQNVEQVNSEFDRLPPAAPAPPPAAPAGQPVYPMNAPAAKDGQPRSIADCNKMLQEATARISALEGQLAEETARMRGANEALQGELARLRGNIERHNAELLAANEATAALRGEKGGIEAELERIRAELAQKLGDLASTSALNNTLTEANRALNAAGADKDATLARLDGQLKGLTESSAADIAAKNAQIETLKANHATELADTNRRYQEDAAGLRNRIEEIQRTSGKLTSDQQTEIASLKARLTALDGIIKALNEELSQSRAATEKEAREKAAAAEAARVAAAAEAEKLEAVTAQGADLRARLEAADAAAREAAAAVSAAKAAEKSAEEAAKAANDRVGAAEAEAGRAREAAAKALNDKGASEREKGEAQAAAAAAEQARAAAAAEADARRAAAAQAAEAAAAAEAGRVDIERRLNVLQTSVPTIVSVTGAGGAGDIVGGMGGRNAVYSEQLTVTWNKGAEERTTWVFVMFANEGGRTVPIYSQLVLNDQPFTFTSTVSGPVQAVVYDVVSHSRGNGAGQINF